jgi:hypothetical protein
MKTPRTALATLTAALFVALALPCVAPAEETIPPGNSAVNQYTESLPTPGGHRGTENEGRKSRPSPHKALGSGNARKLESQGDDGRAAAEVAAETAPSPAPVEEEEATAPAAVDRGTGGGGGTPTDGANGNADKSKPRSTSLTSAEIDEPSGSSGVGEVIGEATGDSSGTVGWLLPLLIIAIAIWAVAYAMRQRRQTS